MSARPEDIARLNAWERRQEHRQEHRHASPPRGQSEHRQTMLCPDCTLTPVVSPMQRLGYLVQNTGTLTEVQVRALLKPLTGGA